MIEVENISKGILPKEVCECESWMDHWDKISHSERPTFCIVEGCYETELEGVLVLKHQNGDLTRYIAPMCKKHATKYDKVLSIISYSWLISADIDEVNNKEHKMIKHILKEKVKTTNKERINNSHK